MQSKYIIFNTKKKAILLNKRITESLIPTWTDGITNNYCNIIKHPSEDKWAVIIAIGYEKSFSLLEIDGAIDLGDDWKTNNEML